MLEPVSFRRLQTRVSKNLFGRLTATALREDWHSAGKAHLLGPRQIKDVIADREKKAVNVSSSRDCQCAAPTSDRGARLVQCGADRVPEPGVRIVRIGGKTCALAG